MTKFKSIKEILGTANKYKRYHERIKEIKEKNKLIEEIKEIYADYSKRNEYEGLKKAMVLLKRYNVSWGRNHLKYPKNIPDYIKGVSNPFAEEKLLNLVQHPALYRLNYIKQLSTVCYSSFLDASHHRMPHSFGTTEVATMFMEALERELPACHFKEINISKVERDAVIIYALVHDFFHGPLGHSLELMRDLLQDDTVRIDKYHLKRNLSEGMVIDQLIKYISEDEDEITEIKKYITFFIERKKKEHSELNKSYFLSQIVDGQIDADRIDYLLRDALHLGKVISDKNRWIDLIMRARVVEEPKIGGNPSEYPRKMIAFSIAHRSRIDEILSQRNIFYHEFYENPNKLALDDMICHLVYYNLKEINFLAEWKKVENEQGMTLSDAGKKLIDEFMKLTDEGLIYFLTELDSPWYTKEILNDFLTNRHFQVIKSYGIKPNQSAEIDTISKDILAKLNKKISSERSKKLEKSPHEWGLDDQRRIEIAISVFQKYKNTKIQNIIENETPSIKKQIFEENFEIAILLLFINYLYNDFTEKIDFEKELWKDVLRNKEVEEEWEKILDKNYGEVAIEERGQLTEIPQIYITPPIYLPKQGTREMAEYFIRDLEGIRVLCYDEQTNKTEWIEPHIRYAPASYMSSILNISIQYDLSFNNSVREIIIKEFMSKVMRLDWLCKADS